MSKTNAERIGNLLRQINQRTNEVLACLHQIRDWPPVSGLTTLMLSLQNKVQANTRLLGAGEALDIDALWDDVNAISVMLTIVPPNTRIVYAGAGHDARLLFEQSLLSIENMLRGIQIGLNRMSVDEIRDTIPKQKFAAYQFGFERDKLVVLPQSVDTSDPDHEIAEASLRALIEQGERVARELSQSNCPPRLIEAFAALQAKLESHKNVVEIGLLNRSCMSLADASADELATTLLEWVKSHLLSVYDFLAQNADWRKFVENALSANLRHDQVGDLASAARAVAAVAAQSEHADSAVPVAFHEIALLADEIKEPDGRVTLGLGRTLENIISLAARCLLGIKDDVQSEARKILARSILLAVSGAAVASLALIPGAEWVPTAISQGLKAVGL